MKKLLIFSILSIALLVLLSSCRPPDLEGAYVDYKAGRIDNALKLAKKATVTHPQNAEAWYLLGELYGKKDSIPEMVQAWDKSLALSKEYEPKIKQAKLYYFQTSFNKGVGKYNAYTKTEDRESDQAKALLKDALKFFQNANLIKKDYKATNLVALCNLLLGNKDQAKENYLELTKIAPDSAAAWTAVGNYYFNQKQYKKATPYLKKALELDPKNVEAVTLLSQAYDVQQDYDNAIQAYDKAKALNKKEKAFPYNLGLIYSKLANKEGVDEKTKNEYLEKSIENFKQVISLDPDMMIPYQLKSVAEISLKKYDDALKTIKTALKHFPDEGSLWFNLGVVYSHKGDKKEATAAFKKAESLGYK